MKTVSIPIDLDEDFDGIDLELAIDEAKNLKANDAHRLLVILHDKWAKEIGYPEWSKRAELP